MPNQQHESTEGNIVVTDGRLLTTVTISIKF